MALKKYELVLVFSLSKGEEAVETLKAKFLELIKANGTLGEVEEWGKRKLAYPINYETELLHCCSVRMRGELPCRA